MRAAFFALAIAATLAAGLGASLPARAQTAPKSGFTIGGEAFTQDEIVDARALPDLAGAPAIMITLNEEAALRLDAIAPRYADKPVEIKLDGALIARPLILELMTSGIMSFTVDGTMAEAEALALRISGRPPLRDELDE